MLKELRMDIKDPLFLFLYNKIRNTTSADTEKEIKIMNKKSNCVENYLIKMDWQDENCCGIEIYEKK